MRLATAHESREDVRTRVEPARYLICSAAFGERDVKFSTSIEVNDEVFAETARIQSWAIKIDSPSKPKAC